jgi:FlaG/FlaF family flagellin (archaellin)
MKGISDVIAMLLMLVITIGLVSLAYSYISGVFTSKTAVVLSQDGTGICEAGATTNSITFWIRNDGSTTATGLTATDIPGNPSTISACTFNPNTIPSGGVATVNCTRSSANSGYYQIRVTAVDSSGSIRATPVIARVYCSG